MYNCSQIQNTKPVHLHQVYKVGFGIGSYFYFIYVYNLNLKSLQIPTRILQCKHFFILFQNLQLIGSFATCEKFWQIFCHLVRPGELTNHCDFHLFKKGIKPLWEDEANRYGGKFLKCFEFCNWRLILKICYG